MAPVSSKRKKALPPLTAKLQEVQRQIERFSSQPAELCKVLQHIVDVDAAWPYEKSDLMHWAKVLDILDGNLAKDDSSDELLTTALKFTRLLLENCNNRHVYNSYEHLKALLEHDSCEVVMAVLRVLSVLATPRSTRQVVCEPPFLAKLSALSTMFSGAANGPLSLAACCQDAPDEVIANGTSVRFQFYRVLDSDPDKAGAGGLGGEGAATVTLYNVHQMAGEDKALYASVMKEHGVPKSSEFKLRSKLRLARCFADKSRRLQWVRVQVMSTTVLAQCQAAYHGVPSGQTPVNEAQLGELTGLLQPEAGDSSGWSPPLDLQTLALKALTALLSERSRHTATLLSSTAAAHHGILSALVRRAKELVNDLSSPGLAERLKFGEALLAFTWMFASSSTGSNALNGAGVMGFILPILQDCDTRRGRFTTLAVRTLEVLMNYSPEMQQAFRDKDGLKVLVDRAHAEACALSPDVDASSAMDTDSKLSGGCAAAPDQMEEVKPSDDAMVQDGGAELVFTPFITKSETADEEFERCKLLGQLMHLMASASTPIATSGDVRELMQPKQKLPELLCKVFTKAEYFGASVFEKAAALLTEFVHQEPSCLQHVIRDDVAKSVLDAISSNLPISRGTVTIVPSVIGALCLSAQGSQFVESMKPIAKFLSWLASESVVPLLVGDTPVQLGGQLEELMRHNPPLLNSCITGCVEIANRIIAISEKLAAEKDEPMSDAGCSASGKANAAGGDGGEQAETSKSTDQTLPAQAYLLSAIEFLGKLLDPLMSVAEHSRAFVRNNGLSAIMKLINRPEIPGDFASTEAGKYIVLVVGKTAFHSPGPVMSEVMQRTQELLDSANAADELRDVELRKSSPSVALCETTRSLELHLTLLSGIVGCLRGSSTASEWDAEKGKKLIDSMATCYRVLRTAAFASEIASESAKVAAEGGAAAVNLSDSAGEGEGDKSGRDAGIVAGQDGDARAPTGVTGGASGLDAGASDSSKADVSKTDTRAEVANAIATLLIRLSSSVANPTRRHRHDDRNAQAQTHEKALATTIAASFKRLLALDSVRDDDISIYSRVLNDAIATMSLCLFGGHAVPLLAAESQRNNVRGGINMLLLQMYEQSDAINVITEQIAHLVTAFFKALGSTDEGSSMAVGVSDTFFRVACLCSNMTRCFAFCKKLLETPLTTVGRNGHQTPLPGFDAAKFNAAFKTKIFAAIEPLWTQIPPASWTPSMASAILDMCLVLVKPNAERALPDSAVPAPPANVLPTFTHDPATVASLVEMGFPEARVHAALDVVQSNSVELATEWLFSHADAGGQDDESSLEAAIALSMTASGASASASASAGASGGADAAAPSVSSAPTAGEGKQPMEEESVNVEGLCTKNADSLRACAVQWCIDILSAGKKAEFAVVDVMSWMYKNATTTEEDRAKYTARLLEAIAKVQAQHADTAGLGSLLRTLAILVTESAECCKSACEQDAFQVVTKLLYDRCDLAGHWNKSEERSRAEQPAKSDDKSAGHGVTLAPGQTSEASGNEWVCASLLVLNKLLCHKEQAKMSDFLQRPFPDNAADAAGSSFIDGDMRKEASAGDGGDKSAEDKVGEQAELLRFCMRLLRSKPDSQLLHAVMDVCARLTRRHDLATIFLQEGGIETILSLPESSVFPGQAISTGALIRHVLEDPASLQLSMQSELRSYLSVSNPSMRDSGRHPTVRAFLGNCAGMLQRNPDIFVRAVGATCRIVSSERGKIVALIDRKEEKGQAAPGDGGANDSMLTDKEGDKAFNAADAPARASAAGAKSKVPSRKGFEAMNQVTALLLTRLLADPRTPCRGGSAGAERSVAGAKAEAPGAPGASGESMQIETLASTGAASSSNAEECKDLPAISPVNLLRYLADLVKFFPGCASFLIRYHVDASDVVKAHGDSGKRSASQEKETFVHFVLRELMPSRSGPEATQTDLSRRSTSLVLALLARGHEVRRRVMTEIVNVLNAPPKARATVHLQMLQSLAGVLFTFLTAKASSPNDVSLETVRQFFDAKVPSALCSAIASIDLHHPSAGKVGSALLRPLEILCVNSGQGDSKASQGRAAEGAASAGGQTATGSDLAPSSTQGGGGEDGANEGGSAGSDIHDLDADASLVEARSELDDAGTHARQAMIDRISMSLSMQEDDDVQGPDEEMPDEGSVEDNMHASDESPGDSDEDGDDDDDGQGSRGTHDYGDEGSQADEGEDGSASQLQDEAWEDIVQGGEHDEDQVSMLASGFERGLAADDFREEMEFEDQGHVVHGGLAAHQHAAHLLSRQELDSMFEQLMESDIGLPDSLAREDQMDDWVDGMDMAADLLDGREGQQPHVLSLLVPGGGAGGNTRILQNLLPFSGLADHMQVIRLPAGRGGRDPGAGADARNALHEVPAAEHPLLARGGNAGGPSDEDRERGLLAGLDGIARSVRQEMFPHEMILAAGGRAWPGGRFLLGEQSASLSGFGQEDGLSAGAASRWSDDGAVSTSAMRAVAQQMESRLVSMLSASATAPPADSSASVLPAAAPAPSEPRAQQQQQPGSPSGRAEAGTVASSRPSDPEIASASAASAEAPRPAGSNSAMEVEAVQSRTPAASEPAAPAGQADGEPAAAVGDAAPAHAAGAGAGVASAALSSVLAAAAAAVQEIERISAQYPESAARAPGLAAAVDAMDEDDEDDELEAALRMSMQAAADSAPSAAQTSDAAGAPQAAAAGAGGAAAALPQGGDTSGEASAGAADGGADAPGAGDAAADAGIDPAFLAELPEDLRAEVMAQQARQSAAASLAASSSGAIDPEFLAALPPDIQADVIRQHQREEAAAAAAQQQAPDDGASAANRSEEMDNASFIASLAPELREEVLITSNDAFLATLPPHLVAEAHLLRERHFAQDAAGAAHRYNPHVAQLSRRQQRSQAGGAGRLLEAQAGRARAAAGAAVVRRQVIEEGRVHHILRLLFLARPVVKSLMNKVLLHLTAHSSSLDATVRFLLAAVLQACGGEVGAGGGKGNGAPEIYGCGCSGNLSDGSMAWLLAKRALEALCHVASHQPNVCQRLLQAGFVSEAEVQRVLARQAASDKGKGKQELEAGALCTPFSLLISLLASKLFSKSTTLQEQVLQVLNCALQPVESAASTRPPSDAAEGGGDSSKGAAKEEEPPSRYPRVALQDISSLTSTLAASGNSSKIMERSTGLLKALSNDPVNLVTCTSHLVSEVRAEAELSRVELESLAADLVKAKGEEVASLASLSGRAEHDMRLLRLAKTLRALWPIKHEGAAGGGKDEASPCMSSQPLAEVVQLDDLWELLGRCLSHLEKEFEKPGAAASADGGSSGGGGASASAAAGSGGTAAAGSGGTAARAGHGDGDAADGGGGAAQQMTMSPALQRMQPLVEAFLVIKAPDRAREPPPTEPRAAAAHREAMDVDKTSGSGAAGGAAGGAGSTSPCAVMRNASENWGNAVKGFVAFAEEHRQALNLYIRQDKALLHSVAYSPLVRFPKLLDFDNKKHYLRSELKRRNAQQRHPNIRINVRREFVFEDSFHQILPRKPEELKGRLTIVFQGEEGVDAGGLTREWYLTLSKQMLNPDKALFIHSSNGLTYQPNPASTIQPDYLKYFKFAGQLVGKALWDDQLLDAHFTQSMYKHMLNQPIEYTDVESIDPEYYRNLGWMLKNDITDILEETFSIVREQFGEMLTIDLKPNGRNLEVTEENKHEYVQLVAEQQMTRGIKEQIDAFKEGFHQLMPPDLISIFTCSELELLMCGLPTIDIEDLRANTEYTGYTRDSPQILWFWAVVQSMVQEDLARLLQFVTGTSQVPMDGFKALRGMNGPQKFNIHRCGDKSRLPSSHTCFNQLDLPEYTSEEQLRKCLLSAIREGFEGFGFS